MKNRSFTRLLSVLLVLVMCILVVPQSVSAAEEEKSETVSGAWTEDKFWRSNRYTHTYEFDKPLKNCSGFTLDFEVLEVKEGRLGGQYKFELYVRKTSGSWKSVKTFYLDGNKATVEVELKSPLSIEAVAVVCLKNETISYVQDLTVRDAVYEEGGPDVEDEKDTEASVVTETGIVDGDWSTEKFYRSNRFTYPFEFYSVLEDCTGFTLTYEIAKVSTGSLSGNYKFAVYARNTKGNWKYVHEFQMGGSSTSVGVQFAEMDVDAVAVLCLKNGSLSYTYGMSVTDPILN